MENEFAEWWTRVQPIEERFITYYMWDSSCTLLYIGITVNIRRRMREHYLRKSWIQEVDRITISIHNTREEAAQEESNAIFDMNPKYNVVGNPSLLKHPLVSEYPRNFNTVNEEEFLCIVAEIGLSEACSKYKVSKDRGRRLLAGYGHS